MMRARIPETVPFSLGHFQLGSYRYSSLIEGLYALWKPYRSPYIPQTPHLPFPLIQGMM